MAIANPRERPAGRVGWLQCSTRPNGRGFRPEAQDTGDVRTNDRLAACSPRHCSDYACVSQEGPQYFRYAVHPPLSRPPTVSDCMPSPMERPSALDQPHTSPGHDAHSHEFTGLYRETDEGIWRGHSLECSIWWHHQHRQREGMDQRSTGIPFHHRGAAKEFLLEWRQDTQGAGRLPRDSQRASDREAVGGLSRQAYTVGAHVPARRAER